MEPSSANSQAMWLERPEGNSISLEVYRPAIPSDSLFGEVTPGFTTLSGAIFLSGKYDVSRDFSLIADLPFAGGNYNDTIYDGAGQFKIGNPYIGGEYRLPQSPLMFELGMRLPVTADTHHTATIIGYYSDFDRNEAFIPHIIPILAAVNYESLSEDGIYLKLRGGVNVWLNSEEANFDTDPRVSVDYSLQGGYFHKYVHVIAGASARYSNDTGPKYPQKETLLQYGISLTFPFKKWHPGISFKVPGNEYTGGFINYVIGLSCSYLFD
jgi:hypothetical protein